MKNKNSNNNSIPTLKTHRPARCPNSALRTLRSALLLVSLTGCTLRQSYPETQIRGYINGQPFSLHAPKDTTLTGFDALTQTNGAIHIHIDNIQSSLNPTNPTNVANGQAAIVTATAQAINQAFQTATAIALKTITP